jgi:hypothetical protein
MAQITLRAQVSALTALVTELADLVSAQAPAKAAPETVSTFQTFLREKAAAKVACAIHPKAACNRKFSPKSSGREGHVARLV